ncbi:glyoxalase/bleomycin resistance/dioxygenase family protein [Nitrosomonas sp. HPC101]|uniref:ArsI/CadI family heavy metal resistance metalloenzyme n=1 Tax=Nitrosomonas sp. HPC101 TaxID=1658667 RepID=UPI00136E199D|nr:ArsI/CadI family heavy metal resistance metalloenzyme [Nitrosomonas sp. HPC101]MXS85549.1 glyoxalase/bleomycin resistance/dioxygenase family protein [Nitrosomonas sp. HPC101]
MKRFHVHVAVSNLEENIRFYSALFGANPVVHESDYAKWMLEDPCINFAISTRSDKTGIDHVGIQVNSDDELQEINQRLNAASLSTVEQKNAQCCYAASDKYWTLDPQGIAWEAYHSLTSIPTFGTDTENPAKNKSCCAL